jgi:GxxExxY protein
MTGTTVIHEIKTLANYAFETLGFGHSERVYHNAMEVLLRKNQIPYETERIVPIEFEGHVIGNMRADLIIDHSLIVELKSVKSITPLMIQQAMNYLNLTGISSGLVINFPQTDCTRCEFSHVEKKNQ